MTYGWQLLVALFEAEEGPINIVPCKDGRLTVGRITVNVIITVSSKTMDVEGMGWT
jgi:hypothetical protein